MSRQARSIDIRPFLMMMGQEVRAPRRPRNIRLVVTHRSENSSHKRAEYMDYSRYPGALLREIRKTHR